jgi:hypothetical protein
MNETEFEEFCFNLLCELGFVNRDLRVVPGDSGRDIVAQLPRKEIDGSLLLA